jgi:phage repressor protein C with HTH and peptisase S24 domain
MFLNVTVINADYFAPGELKRARQQLDLSQLELADKIGVTQPMVNYWETGEKPVSFNKAQLLRDVLGLNEPPRKLIPYYPNVTASAGLNNLTENSGVDVEFFDIPNIDADKFINVFGDSMYPKYCSGEIIGIKEIEKDYVMFGQAYVLAMKNGEAYIKFIKAGKDENHWTLANENKHYEPREFHLDKIVKVFIIKAVITKTTI